MTNYSREVVNYIVKVNANHSMIRMTLTYARSFFYWDYSNIYIVYIYMHACMMHDAPSYLSHSACSSFMVTFINYCIARVHMHPIQRCENWDDNDGSTIYLDLMCMSSIWKYKDHLKYVKGCSTHMYAIFKREVLCILTNFLSNVSLFYETMIHFLK